MRTPILLLAAGAFALRVVLSVVASSPDHPDVHIYMETGRLVNVGLNPYDVAQAPERRQAARLDEWARNEVVDETQELWDYYVSSNLPLSTLLWTAIDRIWPSRTGFLVLFDLLDAVAAALVLAFIASAWPEASRRRDLIDAAIVFAACPAILLYGAVISEDKNVSTALVAGGLLACRSRRMGVTLAGAFLLGCAISYKLVGVFFVVPGLLAAWAALGPASPARRARYTALFGLCALAGAVLPFLPFGWVALVRAQERSAYTNGLPLPAHATPWRLLPDSLVLSWKPLRLLGCGAVGAWAAWRALRRELRVDLLSAFAGVVYVGLWLNSGNLDRFDMVAVPSILLLGTYSRGGAMRLAGGYFLATGLTLALILAGKALHSPALLGLREGFEAASVLLFVIQMAWELKLVARPSAAGLPTPAPQVQQS